MVKTKKLPVLAALVISLFSFGSFAFATGLVTKTDLGGFASISHASDDDEDEDEDEKDEEDKDEDENGDDKDENEDEEDSEAEKKEKEAIKKEKEVAKKKAEYERERLKKQAELLRKQSSGQGGSNEEIENEDEDEKEDGDENEDAEEKDLNEEKADILEDIYDEIIDAEEDILKAQAEGMDVTKALATLAEAKAKAKEAEQSLTTSDIVAAKRLAREVKKLAHFASHKDVKSAEKVQKDIQKISKRIAQTKGKISLLGSLGGDTSAFTGALSQIEADFVAAKALISQGGQEQSTGISALEPLERRVKSIKSSVENALYALGGTDDEYDDDYENEIEDLVEELKDVAEIEGDEVGDQIEDIARAQGDSVKTVGETVEKIDNRNRVLQILFGSKTSDIEKLQSEIAANQVRIEALSQAATKIEDAEVKQILLDQVGALEAETQKLETFVLAQRDRLSLLGWLINLNPGQN